MENTERSANVEEMPGLSNSFIIDAASYDELVFWADELNIDIRTLAGAMKAVGPSLEKITEYLDRPEIH